MFPDYRLAREARSLSAAGHRVLVLSRKGPYLGFEINDPSISVVRLEIESPVSGIFSLLFYITTFLRAPVALVRLALTWKADVIHVQDLSFSTAGFIAAKLLRLPLIVEFRDPYHIMISEARLISGQNRFLRAIVELTGKILALLELLICHAARFVVCVCDEEKLRLLRLGIPANKIVTIMNVPSSDELPKPKSRHLSNAHSPSIVYAGTLSPWKGLIVLLNAFKLLLSDVPHARLIILGDGISRHSLESLATRLLISGNVYFLGWRDPGEAFDIIRSSDVAVIPHLISSMPDKLFVYMHCATPTVASDFSGIRSILDANKCGLLFTNGDEAGLAALLKLVLGDRRLRRRLASNAKLACERYNWDNESLKLIGMYAKLLNGCTNVE